MSPSEPPIRISDPSASRYAFETHCCADRPPPRSRSIAGNATLTIEPSIVATPEPRIAESRVSRWRRVMRPSAPSGNAALPGGALGLRRGSLESVDLDLPHVQHRLHHALGLLPVRIAEQLGQCGRDDLPRDAELVLEPAAGAF